MSIDIGLTQAAFNTKYAPLAVLGYKYTQSGVLTPLMGVTPSIKTVDHDSASKLRQILSDLR